MSGRHSSGKRSQGCRFGYRSLDFWDDSLYPGQYGDARGETLRVALLARTGPPAEGPLLHGRSGVHPCTAVLADVHKNASALTSVVGYNNLRYGTPTASRP